MRIPRACIQKKLSSSADPVLTLPCTANAATYGLNRTGVQHHPETCAIMTHLDGNITISANLPLPEKHGACQEEEEQRGRVQRLLPSSFKPTDSKLAHLAYPSSRQTKRGFEDFRRHRLNGSQYKLGYYSRFGYSSRSRSKDAFIGQHSVDVQKTYKPLEQPQLAASPNLEKRMNGIPISNSTPWLLPALTKLGNFLPSRSVDDICGLLSNDEVMLPNSFPSMSTIGFTNFYSHLATLFNVPHDNANQSGMDSSKCGDAETKFPPLEAENLSQFSLKIPDNDNRSEQSRAVMIGLGPDALDRNELIGSARPFQVYSHQG